MKHCARCGAENADTVSFCGRCSTVFEASNARATDAPRASDPLGGLIPRNNAALLSYYLGLFSIFPLLGLPMAIIALVQGPKGLKAARDQPTSGGRTHAAVGIGCGAVGLLLNLFLIGLFVIGLAASARRN